MSGRSRLRVEALPATHPVVAGLVEEVQQEYVVRYGGRDETPLEVDEFAGDRGVFLVGWLEGRPVATGAWRWHAPVPGAAEPCTEIKRMYVAPSHRGAGLGRDMLRALEQRASRAGSATMILETGLKQPEAISLYRAAGYARIPGFGHYRTSPLSRCFAKPLPSWEGSPLLRDALAVHLEPLLDEVAPGLVFSRSHPEEDPDGVLGDRVAYARAWGGGPDDEQSDDGRPVDGLSLWIPRERGRAITAAWADVVLEVANVTADVDQDVEALAGAVGELVGSGCRHGAQA